MVLKVPSGPTEFRKTRPSVRFKYHHTGFLVASDLPPCILSSTMSTTDYMPPAKRSRVEFESQDELPSTGTALQPHNVNPDRMNRGVEGAEVHLLTRDLADRSASASPQVELPKVANGADPQVSCEGVLVSDDLSTEKPEKLREVYGCSVHNKGGSSMALSNGAVQHVGNTDDSASQNDSIDIPHHQSMPSAAALPRSADTDQPPVMNPSNTTRTSTKESTPTATQDLESSTATTASVGNEGQLPPGPAATLGTRDAPVAPLSTSAFWRGVPNSIGPLLNRAALLRGALAETLLQRSEELPIAYWQRCAHVIEQEVTRVPTDAEELKRVVTGHRKLLNRRKDNGLYCLQCPKTGLIRSTKGLLSHYHKSHPESSWLCWRCQLVFLSKDDFERHGSPEGEQCPMNVSAPDVYTEGRRSREK